MTKPAPNFAKVLEQLQDVTHPFPAPLLYHFSDLTDKDLAAFEKVWPTLPVERRQNLITDLNELAEANYEVSFEAVFRHMLTDVDAEVRAVAVRGLWESEDDALLQTFVRLLRSDPDVGVRAAAASALGRFVYLGELEELGPTQKELAEDALLNVIHGSDDLEVRRRALEAIAFSAHPDVPDLIATAYAAPEQKHRVSAVFAMGRSADPRWKPQVQAELTSASPELRFEAVRAAGELEIAETVDALSTLVDDADIQVREAAIWSLSQIGGEDARETLLNLLENTEDESEQEFIEEALENLDFNEGVQGFDLLDLDDDDLKARLN